MKASDLHHDGLKSSHPTNNSQAPAPTQGWMLLNPSGAVGKSHPLSFGSAKRSQVSPPVQLLKWVAFWMRLKHLSSSQHTSDYRARKGCAYPQNKITGTLVYDDGWDTQSLVGSGQSRDRQSHLLHPLQVSPIAAKPQKKAQAERSSLRQHRGKQGRFLLC